MSPKKKEIYDFDAVTAEEFDAARPEREAALRERKATEALEAKKAKAGPIFYQKDTTR